MSKRPKVLQVLQSAALSLLATGVVHAQFPTSPSGRLFTPPVTLPRGDIDVASAALAGPDNKAAAYTARAPQLNGPQLNTPSAPTTALTAEDLSPPEIDTNGEDTLAPTPPPPKAEKTTAEKPRLMDRVRQRWTRGAAAKKDDPADQAPRLTPPQNAPPIAAAGPAAQPAPTARRGWFALPMPGSAKR